ncbi:MAG: hypothetical protein QOF08_3051 [Gaiellales bacterium]|nr:hypothetical protein [Gaiellales bacterium]
MLRRLPLALAVCGALSAAEPAVAEAHVSPGLISTSYQARIQGLRPHVLGITTTVLDGDQRLRIDVTPPHVVIVLGRIGEPFLRIAPDGVYVNSQSPTAESIGLTHHRTGTARWIRLSSDHAYAWHESRLRPVRAASGASRRVAGWSVPLLVDGRRVNLTGSEWYAAQPRRLLWATLVVLAVAIAAVVLLTRRQRLIRLVATVALAFAVTTWTAGWIGVLLNQRASAWWLLLGALYAVSMAMVVAAAVTATDSDQVRMMVIGLIGLLVVTFTLPELGVFQRGFVLSVLPPDVARVSVAIALGSGIGAALLSLQAAIDGLRASP